MLPNLTHWAFEEMLLYFSFSVIMSPRYLINMNYI